MKDFDLSTLIAPMVPSTFLESHWEREPLILRRNDAGYFTSLLTLDDVDRLVTTSELRTPGFRMVRNGRSLSKHAYTRRVPWAGGAFDGLADLERVFAAYEDGATLVLQALHQRWDPLGNLCRALEQQLRHPCQANVYLTPAGSRGLAPHADTHDVFVLQHHGAKRWRIWDSPVTLPLPEQTGRQEEAELGPPRWELTVRPGDLLYLPRGWLHVAHTEDEVSLHTTVGILTLTWGRLLRRVLERSMLEDEQLRRGVPPELLEQPSRTLVEELARLVAGLGDSNALELEAGGAARRFILDREPRLSGHLLDLERLDEIGLDSPVRRRPGVLFDRERRPDEGTVALSFHGKQIVFPEYTAKAVDHVLTQDAFVVSELPDELDDEAKLVLSRRLVREGFLTTQAAGG